VCHVASPEWAKSASNRHVSQPYWSMSAQVGPTLVWILDKWAPHMPRDTHLLVHISSHPTRQRHMASPGLAVSTRVGHVTFTHWSISAATSLDTCHLAVPQVTTSTDACYVPACHEATSLFEIQQLDTWQHQSEPP
jgi:hypothetical protein